MGIDSGDWRSNLEYNQWVALPVAGKRPSARYKHSAVVVDEKLYIVGGSRNGRYLSDVQAFDLKNLSWSTLKLSTSSASEHVKDSTLQENFPAISGHSMVKWRNKLLLLGGQISNDASDKVTVRFIDLESQLYGVMEATGIVPVAHSGQSVSVVGSKLIMFGGEDKHRKLLNDVRILDLETMNWSSPETIQTPPAPRFDHIATVHADRYLQVFCGCTHSNFFNDLHVLDLETLEWSQPQIPDDLVSPRAGHAGVTIDEKWFIVGGGDNKNGASETLVMDMPKLVISILTNVTGRDPLASEGLTVSSALVDGAHFLVVFGGYNGKYNNESPAAAASVTAAYALVKSESLEFTTLDLKPKVDLSVEINVIKEEKKTFKLCIEEIEAVNVVLKEKLEELNGTHVDLSKELRSVQGQLTSERSRCDDLEAQILDLRKKLSSMQSIEQEVQALRSQKSTMEQDVEDAETVQREGSGGIWRWIAG